MSTIRKWLPVPVKKRTVFLHFCCWSIFVIYELAFLHFTQFKFTSRSIFTFLVYYSVNICLFYAQLGFLDFAFHKRKNNFKCLLLFLFIFLLYLLIKASLDLLFASKLTSLAAMLSVIKTYLFVNIFRGVYFSVFAAFYWVAGNIAGYRKKAELSEKNELIVLKDKAELEKRLSETRNAYLQQQLNPHLLFNSLSFIHSSVYAHSEDAARCVLLLSDIMRFSMDSTGSDDKVLVTDELKQLANLIALNRYRFGPELRLKTSFETEREDLRIIPLVMLTLTENLFKHGFVTDPAYPALLEIQANCDGVLNYRSRNRKKIKSRTAQRRGLGLQNTRIRLDHSYPGSYQLDINEDEDNFELTLTLQL
ncbi:sensor histidine kinase [Mucilaginibacter lutimaris]|uniref:Sensor histidine kinase n=1 Tax=Mucilaginibacter lutimaris TaxID=931629 RepID=A0ABW2ZLW1_9SPHI